MVGLIKKFCVSQIFLTLISFAQQDLIDSRHYWITGEVEKFNIVNRFDPLLHQLESIGNYSLKIQLINQLISKIDVISNYLSENRRTTLYGVSSITPFISFIENEMSEIQTNVNDIKARYDQMVVMCRNIDRYDNSSKRAFAEWSISPGPESISSKLFSVFFSYFGFQEVFAERFTDMPIVDKIALELKYEEAENVCPPVSAQQYFFIDYLEMAILEIKGVLINKFSWTVLRSFGRESFLTEEADSRLEHEKRTKFMTDKLRNIISESGTELRTCDPDVWKEHVNYEQLTRLVQGYVINEVDLNNSSSCAFNCKFFENTYINGCNRQDTYCKKDEAKGKIIRCESDTSKDFLTICSSDKPSRRYDYFETNRGYDINKIYGQHKSCSTSETTVKSWFRGAFICSYCFCLIDGKGKKSDRFFNLREVVSDVAENKVVTGIRFTKKNRIIYLQIQQGQLSRAGLINRMTLEWKPVEEYEMVEKYHEVDYTTLSSNYKSISLDNVKYDGPEYIVTGVKLSRSLQGLYLQVRFTKFDFEVGKLVFPKNTSHWIGNMPKNRTKIPLYPTPNRGPNVSTRTRTKNVPSASHYNMVEFTHSDKIDDASQTTLPFIDSQDVFSQSPTALSGVGLYHRGVAGYGGFIAPKIFTINFNPYF